MIAPRTPKFAGLFTPGAVTANIEQIDSDGATLRVDAAVALNGTHHLNQVVTLSDACAQVIIRLTSGLYIAANYNSTGAGAWTTGGAPTADSTRRVDTLGGLLILGAVA